MNGASRFIIANGTVSAGSDEYKIKKNVIENVVILSFLVLH